LPSSAEAPPQDRETSVAYLRQALRLAARGRYRAAPNPKVGAVLVRDGEIVGSGWHRQAGGPHAEVEALREAGERARGATLYVTLEPCSHHGRTPPCADAVVAAGIARVVVCHRDPDSRVSGRGFAQLRAAGLAVESGFLVEEAVRLNLPFLVAATLRRPAVTLKWAMSLDGRIATATGESQWISSAGGRRWALELREEHGAILVGSGTVLADDPRLDRRLGLAAGPNLRVVLDRRLRTPPAARLFTVEGPVLVYTQSTDRERIDALKGQGAELALLPAVEPAAVLADLYGRGVQSVLVEGGGEVLASFVGAGCYDRVMVDCAPLLIGGRGAPGPLAGEGFAELAAAARLDRLETLSRNGDVILTAYRNECLRELSSSVEG
jgi:diaminohydroxyphosphoribosylaminopyrimidine deaminase/5-amino-6-(5-phosphoribosylamino)uracil reductase